MQKISKVVRARLEQDRGDATAFDTRSSRVSGGTITSWSGPLHIDLTKLFSKPLSEATITGAACSSVLTQQHEPAKDGTVELSDGTKITFATG